MPSKVFLIACFAATITAAAAGVAFPDNNGGIVLERQDPDTESIYTVITWTAPSSPVALSECGDTQKLLHQVDNGERQAPAEPQQTVKIPMPMPSVTLLENRATITASLIPITKLPNGRIENILNLDTPPAVSSAWDSMSEKIKQDESESCNSRLASTVYQHLVSTISSAHSAMASAGSAITSLHVAEQSESAVSAIASRAYESAVKRFKEVSGINADKSSSPPSLRPSLLRTISSVVAIGLASVAVVL